MSNWHQNTIDKLVEEVLNELGHVNHTRPVAPMSAGFPNEPISSQAQGYYNQKLANSRYHLAKSLEIIEVVINLIEQRSNDAGDLVLIKDQIIEAITKFDQSMPGLKNI